MQPTIVLKPIIHKNAQQIGVYFKNDLSLNIIIRKHAAGIWSQTKKCWYAPFNREAFEKLKIALKDQSVLEFGELKEYLESKKKESISDKPVIKNYFRDLQAPSIISISPVNKHVLIAMK